MSLQAVGDLKGGDMFPKAVLLDGLIHISLWSYFEP